eukprot:8326944-Pyramimonas_sp.AAC.1
MRWLSAMFKAFESFFTSLPQGSPSDRSELDRRGRLLMAPLDFILEHRGWFSEAYCACAEIGARWLGKATVTFVISAGVEDQPGLDVSVLDAAGTIVSTALDQCSTKYRQQAFKDWAVWLNEGINNGPRRAHQISRDPAAWRPTSTLSRFGKIASDPQELLRAESNRFWDLLGGFSVAPKTRH